MATYSGTPQHSDVYTAAKETDTSSCCKMLLHPTHLILDNADMGGEGGDTPGGVIKNGPQGESLVVDYPYTLLL